MLKYFRLFVLIVLTTLSTNVFAVGDITVMQSFNKQSMQQADKTRQIVNEDSGKHKILFIMGVILIFLVLITAGLGLAMVMHGKEVFIQHMIFAGATVFLAVAHAVTSIVWFFPY